MEKDFSLLSSPLQFEIRMIGEEKNWIRDKQENEESVYVNLQRDMYRRQNRTKQLANGLRKLCWKLLHWFVWFFYSGNSCYARARSSSASASAFLYKEEMIVNDRRRPCGPRSKDKLIEIGAALGDHRLIHLREIKFARLCSDVVDSAISWG